MPEPYVALHQKKHVTILRWVMFASLVGLTYAWANMAVTMAVLVVVLTLALSALTLYALIQSHQITPSQPRHSDLSAHQPFVSIHVPCCKEPPAIVIQTLQSLSRLNWQQFEVICLDNNTDDPELWQPLQACCESLGSRFKFYHVDQLSGAKAGALNLALTLIDPRTQYIATVDADYQVEPDFLQIAMAGFISTGSKPITHVQLPQAYRNESDMPALADEYATYFNHILPAVNASDAVLLTGTMSVIELAALNQAGGWQDSTITEDAELGIRLSLQKNQGLYINSVQGRGLMPTDFADLRKQRYRWVHGNADTWLSAVAAGFKQRTNLAWLQAVTTQLTAWTNTYVVSLILLLILALRTDSTHHMLAAHIVAAAVVIQWLTQVVRHHLTPANRTGWQACIPHWAMTWEGGTAWLLAAMGKRTPFIRTNKFDCKASLMALLPAIGLTLLFSLGAIVYAQISLWWVMAACLIGGLTSFMAVPFQWQLSRIKQPVSGVATIATSSIRQSATSMTRLTTTKPAVVANDSLYKTAIKRR